MIDDDPHYNPDAPFARRGEFYHTGKEGTRAMTIPDSVTLAQARAFKAAAKAIDAQESDGNDHVRRMVEDRLAQAQAVDDWETFALLAILLVIYVNDAGNPGEPPPILKRLTDALDAVGEAD